MTSINKTMSYLHVQSDFNENIGIGLYINDTKSKYDIEIPDYVFDSEKLEEMENSGKDKYGAYLVYNTLYNKYYFKSDETLNEYETFNDEGLCMELGFISWSEILEMVHETELNGELSDSDREYTDDEECEESD